MGPYFRDFGEDCGLDLNEINFAYEINGQMRPKIVRLAYKLSKIASFGVICVEIK